MRSRQLAAIIAALVLLVAAVPSSFADGEPTSGSSTVVIPDELDEAEDNAADQSKAACDDLESDAGSRVIRRLVDGPRADDGRLAFTSGVCIYLPPGYDTSPLRYPVLYLLHGGFGYQEDWVAQGDVQATMDSLHAQDPANAVIVVMPDGGYGGFWRDDPTGSPRNETYVVDHLVDYVDTHLRSIPGRLGRGIAGLSNGGAGAARLAAKHPDVFGVVSAMSGAFPVAASAPADIRGLADDPTHIADNLDDTPVALIWGAECGDAATCLEFGGGWAFEQACCQQAGFVDALDHSERNVAYEFIETVGAHDWHYWSAWLLEHHGPFQLERLADPVPAWQTTGRDRPPAGFDYRSIEASFDIHGWRFVVDADRATEFLRLSDVSWDAITLTGSGSTSVTTRPVYRRGVEYLVSHASDDGPILVTADDDRRLRFTVDLGTANVVDEYAAQTQPSAGVPRTRTRAVTIHHRDGSALDGKGTIEHVYLQGEQYHYFLYTPPSYDPRTPTPMQLVIHGANTVAEEQLLANDHHPVADREGFLVLYPDFVNTAERHPNSNTSDQAAGLGTHPIRLWDSMDVSSRLRASGDAAAIATMVEQVQERRNVDADRIYVSGMSSGAMMTSLMMGLYPDLFAAGGIIAGCAFASIGSCPVSTDATAREGIARAAHAAMGLHARPVPFIEMHGQVDTTVQPGWGDAAVQQWLMTANLAATAGRSTIGPYALEPALAIDGRKAGGHSWTVDHYLDASGCPFAEHWRIHEMNHFWPGGTTRPFYGNFTDPRGPSGAEATWAFFSQFDRSGFLGTAC